MVYGLDATMRSLGQVHAVAKRTHTVIWRTHSMIYMLPIVCDMGIHSMRIKSIKDIFYRETVL